jgi:hypothetical protein
MKIALSTKLPFLAFPLAFGAAVACGPDKDDSPGEKAGDAVEDIEEGAEEVGDEIDDATN